VFGNIEMEIQPTCSNRAELNRTEAELKKLFKIEEEYWKQKAGMRWFTDGDRNTRFFHSYVKGRRMKPHIEKITTEQGVILESNQQIGEEAVEIFVEQFR